MIIFWQASSIETLMGARIVQGIAAGLLLSALTAAVVDLEPPSRPGSAAVFDTVTPIAGLALGALVAEARSGSGPRSRLWHCLRGGRSVVRGPRTLDLVGAGDLASCRGAPHLAATAGGSSCARTSLVSARAARARRDLGDRGSIFRSALCWWSVNSAAPAPFPGPGGDALTVGVSTACFAPLLDGRRTTLYGTTALAGGMTLTLLALGAASLTWFLVAR